MRTCGASLAYYAGGNQAFLAAALVSPESEKLPAPVKKSVAKPKR